MELKFYFIAKYLKSSSPASHQSPTLFTVSLSSLNTILSTVWALIASNFLQTINQNTMTITAISATYEILIWYICFPSINPSVIMGISSIFRRTGFTQKNDPVQYSLVQSLEEINKSKKSISLCKYFHWLKAKRSISNGDLAFQSDQQYRIGQSIVLV